jgi:hypothetical protein
MFFWSTSSIDPPLLLLTIPHFLLDLLLAFWLAGDAGTAPCDSATLALPTATALLVPVALAFLVPLLVADQSTRSMLC